MSRVNDLETRCEGLRIRLREVLSDTWAAQVLPENRKQVAELLGVEEGLLRDAAIAWSTRRISKTGQVNTYIDPKKYTYSYHHLEFSPEVQEELNVYVTERHTTLQVWIVSLIHHYLLQASWEPSFYKKWHVNHVRQPWGLKENSVKFKLYLPLSVLKLLTHRSEKLGTTRNGLLRSLICSVVNEEKGPKGFGATGTFQYITSRQMFSDVSRYATELNSEDEAESGRARRTSRKA